MDRQHPLTDKLCQSVIVYELDFDLDGGDAHYWLQTERECDNLRAAADWQLEQVIEWLEKKKGGSMKLHSSEVNSLVIDLKAAMRPQYQQEDN